MTTAADLARLADWIGRTETQTDYVTIPAVHRLAATLDRDDPFPRAGDPLPAGWHSILFPRIVRQSEIGADGHPERGDFLPPVPLPRRMFAGRRTTFHAPLCVGDEARKDSTIAAVNVKEGRSGTMVFVTVRAEIHGPQGLAVVDEQDIVYRGEPARGTPPAPPQPAPANVAWTDRVMFDEVRLFRYSALTFNGHRIHYDHPYVTGVEHYPALVVNGGLTTLYLYELLRRHSRRPLRALASRNVKPLYAGNPIGLGAQPSADGATAEVFAADHEGALAVTARAEFA